MSKIYWLVSYPKSGNTWLRILLTNYWRNAEYPAAINYLEPILPAGLRQFFELYTALDSTELTDEEIDCYRPAVYRRLVINRDTPQLLKVHDAYQRLADGQPLFPTDVTAGVIYIIRNPLAVAPSLAAHMGYSVDRAIAAMNDETYALCAADRSATQLRQRLFSWSGHVNSWTTVRTVRCCVIRYEDMCAKPLETFGRVLHFLHEPLDQQRLRKAVAFSAFEQLQTQEILGGFNEKPGCAGQFFRRGQANAWQDELSAAQRSTIITYHQATMKHWGY